jgi:hypothetical protein
VSCVFDRLVWLVVDVCVCLCSVLTGADDLSSVVEDTEACYICFDPVSEQGRELMPSPCACKKPVHRACLSKWIATKGSRLCSICKGKLPIDFTVDAPFVVLQVCVRLVPPKCAVVADAVGVLHQVVRHMRGLHWAGEREYIISFSQRSVNYVTIGSGVDCDLSLPDPSLSRNHSRITFREDAFFVEDMSSSAGTFLKLTGAHSLPVESASIFKLGRTMLTIKIEKRKQGGGNASGLNVLRSWRAKHRKLPLSPASALAHGIVVDAEGNIQAEGVDPEELERRLAAALNIPPAVVEDGKLGEDGDGDARRVVIPEDEPLDADDLGAEAVATPVHVLPRQAEAAMADFDDDDMSPPHRSAAVAPATVVPARVMERDASDDDGEAEFQAQLAAATAASLLTAATDSKLGDMEDE